MLHLAVLVEHRLVTDRWMGGRTDRHRPMASTAEVIRAVKTGQSSQTLLGTLTATECMAPLPSLMGKSKQNRMLNMPKTHCHNYVTKCFHFAFIVFTPNAKENNYLHMCLSHQTNLLMLAHSWLPRSKKTFSGYLILYANVRHIVSNDRFPLQSALQE